MFIKINSKVQDKIFNKLKNSMKLSQENLNLSQFILFIFLMYKIKGTIR